MAMVSPPADDSISIFQLISFTLSLAICNQFDSELLMTMEPIKMMSMKGMMMIVRHSLETFCCCS